MTSGVLQKLPQHREVAPLTAGGRSTATTLVKIPPAIPPGTYLVRACADVFGKVSESHEGNNCRLTATTIEVTLPLLMVTTQGPGSGIISADHPEINCGTECSSAYPYGTSLTLSAHPASDSAFAGWESPWIGGCFRGESAGQCTVTMDNDKKVTAYFGPVLTVTLVGPGEGSVALDPPSLTCEADCAQWYAVGSMVTLSATSMPGSSFMGWSGSCTGTAATCTLVMNHERAASAFFGPGSLPGTLDVGFGRGGRVTTNFHINPDGTPSFDLLYTLVLQPDGKIVAGGEVGTEVFGDLHDFALARYNPDGGLDSSFGSGGKVTTDFKDNGFDLLYALALQPDGKLIGAGRTSPPGGSSGGNFDFALARYHADGSLDLSFGNAGKVTTDFDGQDDAVRALAIQTDGKILAAGRGHVDNSTNFALARYHSDGSLDSAFGVGGKVSNTFDTSYERGLAMVLQPDGKIIVAGSVYQNDPSIVSPDFGLVRYDPDGSLDLTFGVGGKVTTDFGDFDQIRALLLQPNGKILVAGTAGSADDLDFGLARYHPDGSLDSTFGEHGKARTDFGGLERIYALLLQSDGKIIAGGAATYRGREISALARYHPDGSLDPSFGVGGKMTSDFGTSSHIRALLLHPDDGKLWAGGIASSRLSDFSIERYHR
jgi:uncharacterized delta-60 repeat protein